MHIHSVVEMPVPSSKECSNFIAVQQQVVLQQPLSQSTRAHIEEHSFPVVALSGYFSTSLYCPNRCYSLNEKRIDLG